MALLRGPTVYSLCEINASKTTMGNFPHGFMKSKQKNFFSICFRSTLAYARSLIVLVLMSMCITV